jgi:hypothetical protein
LVGRWWLNDNGNGTVAADASPTPTSTPTATPTQTPVAKRSPPANREPKKESKLKSIWHKTKKILPF